MHNLLLRVVHVSPLGLLLCNRLPSAGITRFLGTIQLSDFLQISESLTLSLAYHSLSVEFAVPPKLPYHNHVIHAMVSDPGVLLETCLTLPAKLPSAIIKTSARPDLISISGLNPFNFRLPPASLLFTLNIHHC